MKVVLKNLLLCIVISICMIFVLSLLISFTSLGENIIGISIVLISAISIFISSINLTRSIKEKGYMYGMILASVYIAILYIISSLLNLGFIGFSTGFFIVTFFNILSGFLGGIIGVNFLK